MIDFLIEHPTASREEMALHFGVTRAWLSTIIHSQAFQAALKNKQEKVFNSVIARPLQERLLGAAHLALDRLEKKLETEEDTETLRKVLETLGRGSGAMKDGSSSAAQNNTQINLTQISVEDITHARSLIGRVKAPFDGNSPSLPALEENVQPGGQSLLGSSSLRAALQVERDSEPTLPGGDQV